MKSGLLRGVVYCTIIQAAAVAVAVLLIAVAVAYGSAQ
jgi:hypothetical protein